MNIPALTSQQMAELDRRVVEDYHIDLLLMMENAGRALAIQAKRFLGGTLLRKNILILAGKGNNGGGGLASARHLNNWGANVNVVLSSSRVELKEAPAIQLQMLQAMKIQVMEGGSIALEEYDLLVDALLGYNQRGNPKAPVAELVRLANESPKPILALDIPTGLDPDTGYPNTPCIRAVQTLTLAAPKKGLVRRDSRRYVGDLFLADISVPRVLYREYGIDSAAIFAEDSIVPVSLEDAS